MNDILTDETRRKIMEAFPFHKSGNTSNTFSPPEQASKNCSSSKAAKEFTPSSDSGSLLSLLEESLNKRAEMDKEEYSEMDELRKKLTENVREDIIKDLLK